MAAADVPVRQYPARRADARLLTRAAPDAIEPRPLCSRRTLGGRSLERVGTRASARAAAAARARADGRRRRRLPQRGRGRGARRGHGDGAVDGTPTCSRPWAAAAAVRRRGARSPTTPEARSSALRRRVRARPTYAWAASRLSRRRGAGSRSWRASRRGRRPTPRAADVAPLARPCARARAAGRVRALRGEAATVVGGLGGAGAAGMAGRRTSTPRRARGATAPPLRQPARAASDGFRRVDGAPRDAGDGRRPSAAARAGAGSRATVVAVVGGVGHEDFDEDDEDDARAPRARARAARRDRPSCSTSSRARHRAAPPLPGAVHRRARRDGAARALRPAVGGRPTLGMARGGGPRGRLVPTRRLGARPWRLRRRYGGWRSRRSRTARAARPLGARLARRRRARGSTEAARPRSVWTTRSRSRGWRSGHEVRRWQRVSGGRDYLVVRVVTNIRV